MSDTILKLMAERRQEKNRQEYERIHKEIDNQIQAAKEHWLQERCNEVEQLQERHKNREELQVYGNPRWVL